MHFTVDDFPLCDETTAAIPTDFTGAFAQLKALVDQISLEQVQSKFQLEKLKADLSKRISLLETAMIIASENQDQAILVQTNFIRKEIQDHKAALSTDLDVFRKEVQDQKAVLSNDLMEFHVQAQENYNTLTTQLYELVDYINWGSDAKKGEMSSSRGPQPPPDDINRPRSGDRAIPILLNCEYQDAMFKDERVVPVYLGGERLPHLMSEQQQVELVVIICYGFLGFSAGRGFDPAGGAPGGG
ncbi:nuclear matrix constituent protein 1-like protein [Dorcoceras hygrometricum]|uniref:Nuclear matrix constituent protein 1-like protein n=1 Tax=Dorcoceras hygrometricum TaxID=472368 RepID=A0A2Z7A7U3_9LAMI|nr:nuclear matrix constituent protein 1-like protein [Dorcoceras hygrometricum]